MKKLIVGATLALALVAGSGSIGCRNHSSPEVIQYIPGPSDEVSDSPNRQAIVSYHNSIRTHNGLSELIENELLHRAAQKHADEMASRKVLSHTGKNWSQPSGRVEAQGYQYRSVAENIARGQTGVHEVMQEWMDSRGHRHNILGDYREIGVGISVSEDGRVYWCVVFGSRFH